MLIQIVNLFYIQCPSSRISFSCNVIIQALKSFIYQILYCIQLCQYTNKGKINILFYPQNLENLVKRRTNYSFSLKNNLLLKKKKTLN